MNKASTGGAKGEGAGTTKLPPIQRKPTLKKDSAGTSQQQQMRSTGNKSAFGAKSIDLLKSL
jgi:hypothetical protein